MSNQEKQAVKTLIQALRDLAAWPQSTPDHPSITSQDVPMRRRAEQALASVADLAKDLK